MLLAAVIFVHKILWNLARKTVGLNGRIYCLMRMENLKCKFELFRDTEWKVSRPTICGPLEYCIERWATIIVRR